MGLFGKSEEELKKIAQTLDSRKVSLDNRESDINDLEAALTHKQDLFNAAKGAFEKERSDFATYTVEEREKIAKERQEFLKAISKEREAFEKDKAELLDGQKAFVRQKAEAQSHFASEQLAAFKDVIETQIAQLDARQRELDDFQKKLASQSAKLNEREGNVAKRELSVTEREQKSDAGFAEKAKGLADEAKRQYEANAKEATRLTDLAQRLSEERKEFEEQRAALCIRESELLKAEQVRDAGYAEARKKNESEIANHREEELAKLEKEISELRQRRIDSIDDAENAERKRIQAEIEKERKTWEEEKENAQGELQKLREELEREKGRLDAEKGKLEGENERLLYLKKRNDERFQNRMGELDQEVEDQIRECKKTFNDSISQYEAENESLRKSLKIQTGLTAALEHTKLLLGDKAPEEIIRDLQSKTDELRRLKEELATRPTEEMRKCYEEKNKKCQELQLRLDTLEQERKADSEMLSATRTLQLKNEELEAVNKTLAQKASLFEGAANEAQAELERLRAAYERPAEVNARKEEIESPYLKKGEAGLKDPPKQREGGVDELEWLDNIEKSCDKYGLHFNPRIIRAFHTALKTAEWAPLTVLAGVSGTGKSELPRLYSHFGGLFFDPISVQPNWDSQESLLGFFNSIDNKFDAQPVLRFLAQSQKEWADNYPGLKDAVCMVLLDEMNLAHPELYFAEFLSKLELRRGMKRTDLPTLPVKIGAGLPPYSLPLGRNVLWTGTMNQDETTKSLSDKVLDRSIVIHFPRPTELQRRLKLDSLDDKNRGELLHQKDWFSWMATITDRVDGKTIRRPASNFSEDEIAPYKKFIEEMNSHLGEVGRAIGHRVWQSVEYYMANYPDVRVIKSKPDGEQDKEKLQKCLHTAFEDQLVQKVMPKLRGIDTRGDSKTNCLDKIRSQIVGGVNGEPFNLAEDFDLACKLGYGQFIWQSANYLKEEPHSSGNEKKQNGDEVGDAVRDLSNGNAKGASSSKKTSWERDRSQGKVTSRQN